MRSWSGFQVGGDDAGRDGERVRGAPFDPLGFLWHGVVLILSGYGVRMIVLFGDSIQVPSRPLRRMASGRRLETVVREQGGKGVWGFRVTEMYLNSVYWLFPCLLYRTGGRWRWVGQEVRRKLLQPCQPVWPISLLCDLHGGWFMESAATSIFS